MKIFLGLLILLVVGVVIFYFLQRGKGSSASSIQKEITYGPFVIKAESKTQKTADINYGLTDQTTVKFSIWHEGKVVPFPAALQTNTGLEFLWRVYALPDAPTPTLLAGSQSLYLISIKDGQPVVEPILEQSTDFATIQFLDSEGGQPGPHNEVFARNDTAGMEQLEVLQGGQYLLVSGHAVLDVKTGKINYFNKDNAPVDNYSYPQPHGALAFSPDRKKIVFNSVFQSWNTQLENLPESEHALVVVDFVNDKGSTVIYDDTDTRMNYMEDINLEWFNTYFEWNQTGDVLSLKKWDKLPNWKGKFDERDNYYYLYPVKAEMLQPFKDFVLQQMNWNESNILSDTTTEYSGRTLVLGAGTTKLDIVYKADDQKILFSKGLYETESEEYKALVQKIAKAFDEVLLSGKHQEHFGRIRSESKRIAEM